MERVALDGELGHLGIRDLDALGIAAGVDLAADGQAGLGGRGADQLNDNLMADQRLAAPGPGDVGEEPVFDPVPFAGPGRQVRHGDGQAGLVGKALQLALPQPHAGAVAAAAVGGDDQPLGLGVARLAEFAPPAPDALDREGRRARQQETQAREQLARLAQETAAKTVAVAQAERRIQKAREAEASLEQQRAAVRGRMEEVAQQRAQSEQALAALTASRDRFASETQELAKLTEDMAARNRDLADVNGKLQSAWQ